MQRKFHDFAVSWFEEVWNKGRRDAVTQFVGPDTVLHEGDALLVGPESFYPFFDRMRATFSDMQITVEDSFGQNDLLCVRWTSSMTHSGDGFGMPATGKRIKTTGITIMRIRDGQMAEVWQNWDMLGLLQQIQETAKAATYVGQHA